MKIITSIAILPYCIFLILSCHKEKNSKNSMDNISYDQTHEEIYNNKEKPYPLVKELLKFIKFHENKLNTFSDSIYYLVIFDPDKRVYFNTSLCIPELLDSSSIFAGITKIKNHKIIIIENQLSRSKKFYKSLNLNPIKENAECIKDALYTPPLEKVFSIQGDSTLIEIN